MELPTPGKVQGTGESESAFEAQAQNIGLATSKGCQVTIPCKKKVEGTDTYRTHCAQNKVDQ